MRIFTMIPTRNLINVARVSPTREFVIEIIESAILHGTLCTSTLAET